MSITFSKSELKAYPKLPLVEGQLQVIAIKGCDYEGLEGRIDEIKYGKEKETENDTVLDIYVEFEEPEYSSVETTHPHLNGTSISGVICGEDELGFKFTEDAPFYQTADGKIVCPHCYTPVERVTETQSEDIEWNFENGEYVKSVGMGSSEGKRCDQCNGELEDADEAVLSY